MSRTLASLAACLSIATVAVPARAGTFTLTSAAERDPIEFKVVCIEGGDRTSEVFTIQPGQTTEVGDEGCTKFEMIFSTDHGVRQDYAILIGKSYRLFWNSNRWDLEPG